MSFPEVGSKTFYILVLTASLVITRIPFLGRFVRTTNTVFHELGHALMALFTSGSILKIQLSYDTSGSIHTQSKYWIAKVFVSLAGYPFASAIAYAFWWLIKSEQYSIILIVTTIAIALSLVLWVRNTYGVIWCLLSLSGLFATFYFKKDFAIEALAIIITGVITIESIVSAFVLLYISLTSPKEAGDATNLKTFTYVPAFIWGLLFVGISLVAGYLAIVKQLLV